MSELATTPWWVVLGIAVALATGIFAAGRWVGSVNADRKSFEGFMKGVKGDIREIRNDIKKILHWRRSRTLDSGSPLRLTSLGMKISEELAAPAIISTLAPILRRRAEGKHAYDIQELSFSFIHDEYEPSAELDAGIKQCAFDNGLDRDEVLNVLAIELRDKLIELAGQAESG